MKSDQSKPGWHKDGRQYGAAQRVLVVKNEDGKPHVAGFIRSVLTDGGWTCHLGSWIYGQDERLIGSAVSEAAAKLIVETELSYQDASQNGTHTENKGN